MNALPSRLSDSGPTPAETITCNCGLAMDADETWCCTHRVHGNGLMCAKQCCTGCQSEAARLLECCDDHLESAIKRAVKTVQRYGAALANITVRSGEAWAKAYAKTQHKLPHCFYCNDSGDRGGGTWCSCVAGRERTVRVSEGHKPCPDGGVALQVHVPGILTTESDECSF